jgi:hypothetical protein
MNRLVLTITVCTSIGNIEREFKDFDPEKKEISFHEIDVRVKQLLHDCSISQKPLLYYRERREEEKRLRGDEKFSFNVHVFVRFEGDYRLMMNRIESLQLKYQQ